MSRKVIPFDFIASKLVGEPYLLSRQQISDLDPTSARLLYFREKFWDDEVQTEPEKLTQYDLFVRRFKKIGYLESELPPLWEKFSKIQEERQKLAKQKQKKQRLDEQKARSRRSSPSE